MSAKKSAIAIDGNCLMYRCFYATIKQLDYYHKNNLTPTNALNLFIYSIFKLLDQKKYDYALIAFDHSKHTFRSEQYNEYKAGRKPMPDDLVIQVPLIKEAVKHLGFYAAELNNYEADDLIGSYTKLMNNHDINVDIYSTDHDMFQLVNPLTKIIVFKSGISVTDEINIDNFKEKFLNLNPSQVADFKGIAGDNSDHLKGVSGIGPKTASNLLQQFEHLENIYDNIDSINNQKVKQKLLDNKIDALKCKKLSTIFTDLFIKTEIDDFIQKPIDMKYFLDLTKKYKLYKLYNLINTKK